MKLHDQPYSSQQVKHAQHMVQRQDSNLPPVHHDGDRVVTMVNLFRQSVEGKTKAVGLTLPLREKQRTEVEVKWKQKRMAVMPKAHDVWKKAKSTLKFLDWLDHKQGRIHFDDKEVDLHREPSLRFFEPDERPTLRVQFDGDNRVLDHTNTPLPEGTYMFIVGVDNHVYVAKEERKRVNHASFWEGGETLGAGELTVGGGGNVTEISNKSGHYRPQSIHSFNALMTLSQKGLDISSVTFKAYCKKGQHGDLRGRLVPVSPETGIKSPRSFEPESPSLKTKMHALNNKYTRMLMGDEPPVA